MILLDGVIILGYTLKLSLYSKVKDLSMVSIQKTNALDNSAIVKEKSTAILFAFWYYFKCY